MLPRNNCTDRFIITISACSSCRNDIASNSIIHYCHYGFLLFGVHPVFIVIAAVFCYCCVYRRLLLLRRILGCRCFSR